MKNLHQEFTEQSISRICENTPKIFTCLDLLSEEEIWHRHNENTNSIGNLVLHLCGNIRQYIISSLDDQPDTRLRDEEFSASGGYSREELKKRLNETVAESIRVISDADEESLMKIRSVQGFQLSGIGIIIHVTEHYSYHTGQIIALTKLLKNKDLGFYASYDLNQKNINQA